jgi:hypothetical protein
VNTIRFLENTSVVLRHTFMQGNRQREQAASSRPKLQSYLCASLKRGLMVTPVISKLINKLAWAARGVGPVELPGAEGSASQEP